MSVRSGWRNPVLALLFLLSGASGLIYQTAWTRLFQDLFGHGVHTTAAVLAAFMAGLAVGAALAGRIADRLRGAIRVYAYLEFGLALWVWTSPLQVAAVDAALPVIVGSWWVLPGPGSALRWLLAFALVGLPASVMGATLPILCRALTTEEKGIGKVFGSLYGINTLGAVLGVVAAGYWLIRYLGVVATITSGCLLGLGAGAGALALSLASREERVSLAARSASRQADLAPTRLPLLIVGVIFGSGFVAMAYEIVWIRYFVFILGSNILSFSMVLGTLLLALSIGSLAFPWLVARRQQHLSALVFIEFALAVAGGLTVFLFLRLDTVIGGLRAAFGNGDLLATTMGRSLLTGAVLVVPGLLMGAVLPAATGAVADLKRCGRAIGNLYAANTAGNIAGSLVAGYLLIPTLGSSRSLVLLAAINIILGVVVLVAFGQPRRVWPWLAAAASTGALVWLGVTAGGEAAAAVAARPNPHASLTAVREGLRGTVTVYDVLPLPVLAANRDLEPGRAIGNGYRLIAVDGVDVAGSSPDLLTTQKMQAHIPLLLHGAPASILQVGYGSGKTTQEALLHGPELFHLVELNPDVVREANHWFPDFATSDFTAFFTDAKNYVRTTKKRYDVILNDSTYPGVAGSSQLYSEDHFRACRAHLNPGGVLSTWLPVDLPAPTLRMVLSTFSAVFPHCSFWLPANCWNKHGVLVGSLGPQPELVASLGQGGWPESVRSSLIDLGYGDPELFVSMLVLDDDDIRAISEGAPVNNDDHPYLEYPLHGVEISGEQFWAEILRMILGRLGPPGRASQHPLPIALADCVRMILSGQLALLNNDPDTALEFYRRAHHRWSTHPGPQQLRRDILTFQAQAAFSDAVAAGEDSDQAAGHLQRAVALCPQAAAAQYELGRLLFAGNHIGKAVPHLEQAVRLSVKLPRAHLFLGDAYRLGKRYDQAEASYRAYLADQPAQFEILVALADAIASQGRADEAIPLLEQALVLSPGHQVATAMLTKLRG